MAYSPAERDLLVRTIIGEAGGEGPLGKAAVAHVVLNRARLGNYGGHDLSGVILKPAQFEPWTTRAQELWNIPQSSPKYQSAAQIADSVLAGETPDPTNGATHFAAAQTLRDRGDAAGQPGGWFAEGVKRGGTVTIGGHTFLKADAGRDDAPGENRVVQDPGSGTGAGTPPLRSGARGAVAGLLAPSQVQGGAAVAAPGAVAPPGEPTPPPEDDKALAGLLAMASAAPTQAAPPPRRSRAQDFSLELAPPQVAAFDPQRFFGLLAPRKRIA